LCHELEQKDRYRGAKQNIGDNRGYARDAQRDVTRRGS
jgi:hypothetical protein